MQLGYYEHACTLDSHGQCAVVFAAKVRHGFGGLFSHVMGQGPCDLQHGDSDDAQPYDAQPYDANYGQA